MPAESRGRDPLGPGAPWRSPDANDGEDKGSRGWRRGAQREQASSRRSCFLGLEVNTELVWEDWDLGREFTKTLVLKNVYSKLQKLHLRPPASKFFSTVINQTILLSPGTSFTVPVIFKPLQRCEYEDSIEFQGKDGSFQVFLRATFPCHALEVPESVLLPVCAVSHSTHTTFRLKNASHLQTWFQWVCESPFQMNPEKGLLKPNQECQVTVIFRPQEALVHQQQANCMFGEENNKESSCTVLLQGLAKYPYLQLRKTDPNEKEENGTPVLNFGSFAVGQSLQKRFEIFNPSPVAASFSVSRLSGGVPLFGSEFSCDVTTGKVAPGESQQVAVTYFPAVVDTVSVEYLSIDCGGSLSETLLKLTGTCIGPRVSLSSAVVDFGCVKEGGTVEQTLKLVNPSPVVAFYQCNLDCNGHSVFSIQPASGTVCPHSHTMLKAVYRPTQARAHHRRVACLILHQEPLFLDLIGTCHSDFHQPAILRPEHLILYSGQIPTDTSMQQVQLDQQDISSTLEESNQRPDSAAVSRSPMEEFFQSWNVNGISSSSSLSSPHISVVPNELLFNHNMSSSVTTLSASCQFVSITNRSRRKLSLVWTVAQDSPFTVSPTSCHLAPLKSTSFTVTYDPKQLNTLHGAQLECFAFNKENQHKGNELLCLPWCVTVRVIGHSFQLGKEHFVPCCSLKPARVVFPALSAVSYQTVLLQNGGVQPLTFCRDHSSNPALTESVYVTPSCGLIQPGDHQILTLRTIPTEDSPKEGFSLQLQLNATKHTKELTIVSVAEKPCVSLEADSGLYFRPTAVGSQTRRSKHIRNLSRLPLRFQWSIPESDQGIIFVEPDVGELHPNESAVQTWSFSPLEEKIYRVKPTLTFWPSQSTGCDRSQLCLEVEGTGSIGFIKGEEAVVDVGEILVGSYRSIEIPLINDSPCSVSFCLSVKQQLLDDDPINDPETKPSALELDCKRGTIASQCKLLLQCSVRPQRRAQYVWTISYQTLNSSGLASSSSWAVCEVRAQGVFPTLQVIDVCSSGNVGRLSKHHLWGLFSLDRLNKHLLSNPESSELTYRTPTRHSLHSSPLIFTKANVDFNFSAAPLNSDPSTFVLMFHNPGSVPVDWAFLFPEDQQIELEYWAQTGELDSTDFSHMHIQDNHLFNISPRTGTLQPGQQRAVLLTYSHTFVGIDRISVVLKLSHGREILLNFEGVTVERHRPYLHFVSDQHVLSPISIGDTSPPKQVFEVHNAGAVLVHYEVDTSVLSQLQVENFNHPVLCCLNPEGEVLPGKVATLEWIFSPLEPRMYHMEIPIHIQDGDSILMRIEGCGLDTPTLGSPNSDSKPSVPCVQRVSFAGQAVFLSEDSISLGDMPVSCQCSRILFLTNKSCTDTFQFTWDLAQQRNQQEVWIHPNRGRLCPGESVLCVLTFTSADYPALYQLDVICQVDQEAATVQYHDDLKVWEEEGQRRQEEFTITDKSPTDIPANLTDKEPHSVTKGPSLRKYKTLPPICSSSRLKQVGDTSQRPTKPERCAPRETPSQIRRPPEPPQPSLLHLEVTARSHVCLDYIAHFPDQFSMLYKCLSSDKSQNPKSAFSTTDVAAQPTQEPGKDVTAPILMSLLKNILDDSAFSQSLLTVASRPIIYQPTQPFRPHYPPIQSSPHFTTCPTSPHPEPKAQVVSSGTEGTLEAKTQNKRHTAYVPVHIAEEVLRNTLQNLMLEAVSGELVLTAHPRSVSLPPASARTRRTARAAAEKVGI
ncbi:cilia- and flagella-associated protein 65 [Betta splendens]|uniref:Cilia- and flagella-associated protein 65 n=1 Tax=Betta splendens TaxID=158456 RepID=A0A6P7LFT8_BETSP|nr:cilia- and flagella-associated protein 65 [Betta splendens]XP_028993481.1 cilia- and flagella-associated protein 65 [Betta splendens]